jgi:tight adherence protein C
MSPFVALSLALGLGLGCGLFLVLMALPRLGAIPLYRRIAPYVADISEAAFSDVIRQSGSQRIQRAAGLHSLNAALGNLIRKTPANSALSLNLHRAGWSLTDSEFRVRRLVWVFVGAGAGAVLVSVVGVAVPVSMLAFVIFPVVSSCSAYVAVSMHLQHAATIRLRNIEGQLPAIWEFIALCVTAGESLPDALNRVVAIGHGAAVDELRRTTSSVEAGIPLAHALTQLSTRLQLSPLSRGIEQVLGALHKGTPLASVLQEHARDAREDSKRRLLESAGKKEVAMLVPLVFLILPVTILFAVFPGLLVIQSGF